MNLLTPYLLFLEVANANLIRLCQPYCKLAFDNFPGFLCLGTEIKMLAKIIA
jgi:hypothetical protein